MEKAIITGATGFIGKALVKCLTEKNVQIFIVARSRHKALELLTLYPNYVTVIECDLRDVEGLKQKVAGIKADVFYHLAWFGLKEEGLTDYRVQMSAAENSVELIEIAAMCGCRKFIGMGSITQFETIFYKHAMIEGDRCCFYKTAKLTAQLVGIEVSKKFNIDFIWPIITNVYGAGEKSDRLINTLIRKLLAGESMSLTDGKQNYDFIYITDACEALYLLGEYGKDNTEYVIGSGEVKPLKDWLLVCKNVLNSKGELLFGEKKQGYFLPAECFDTYNLFHDTGYVPQVTFEEGIKKTSDWLRLESRDESCN